MDNNHNCEKEIFANGFRDVAIMRYEVAFNKFYENRKEVAKAFGVNYYVLNTRIRSGMTLEEALEMGESAHLVEAFGKRYKSLVALSSSYGIECSLIEHRMSQGKSIEESVLEILNAEKIEFHGKQYSTLTNLANEYKIEGNLLAQRIRSGWTIWDAIMKPVTNNSSGKGFVFRGVPYASQRELATAFDLNVSLVYNVRDKYELEFVQAMEILVSFLERYKGDRPKISKIPFVIYDGVWYDTLKNFCTAMGVTHKELRQYMKNNKISSHYKAFCLMSTIKRYRWKETNSTGEKLNVLEISRKYHTQIDDLESYGFATKEHVRSFPNCIFDSTLPYETPLADFKEYLSNLELKEV